MPNITENPSDHCHHHHKDPSRKPLQLINQEKDDSNKFFSRLLSKETSIANNSSFRVYYGGVVGAVPFTWEAQPSTPKHTSIIFNDDGSSLSLPPLTPPPSSFRSTASNPEKVRPGTENIGRRSSGFLRRLLRKIEMRRPLLKAVVGPSNSLSSSSGFVPIKLLAYHHDRRTRFSSQGSFDSINPVDYEDDEEEEEHTRLPGQCSCFAIGRRRKAGPPGCHG